MRLVAAMVVRNEADRYLPMVLDDLERYCDAIVVLDDGSTDATPEVCAAHDRVRLHRNGQSLFWSDEAALRGQLWALSLALNPEWVLAIDADEVMEQRFSWDLDALLSQRVYPVIGVHVHEFWGCTTHYRVDKLWNPVEKYTPMLVRNLPGLEPRFAPRALHCGRIPAAVRGPMLRSGVRCKHFGYANPADPPRKYQAYIAADPHGRFCLRSHYESILDPPDQVVLERWTEI